MRVFLLSLIALLFASGAAAQSTGQVFYIDFTVEKTGQVLPHLVRIIEGNKSIFEPSQTNAELVILSLDNRELTRVPFFVDFTFYDVTGVDINAQRLALRVPYFLTAKIAQIYKDGNLLGEINLEQWLCSSVSDNTCSEFCKLKNKDPDCRQCGNGLCEANEDKNSCAVDCAAALGQAPLPQDSPWSAVLIIAGLIIAGGTGFIWWRQLRR